MAISKIHALYNTIGKAISYITDETKTKEGCLVSSFGCSVGTAAIEMKLTAQQGRKTGNRIGYHMFQAFSPEDEVTPEKAHELGKEFADQMLKGKYEYVIATHVDKGHIHNHIIFNSTSFYDFKKYHHDKKDTQRMQDINDKICEENNLSVIVEKSGARGKSQYEYKHSKAGTSWKDKLRFDIDKTILEAKSFDDFIEIMKLEGYAVERRGKFLRFKAPEQDRFIRLKESTLGADYTEEAIIQRIANPFKEKNLKKEEISVIEHETKTAKNAEKAKTKTGKIAKKQPYKPDKKRINLIIDISKNIKAQESHAYEQALVRSNINTLVKTMNFLINNNIQTPQDFSKLYISKSSEYDFLRKDVNNCNEELIKLSEKIKFTKDYKHYHNLYVAAMRAGTHTKFYKEHETEIVSFKAAQLYFTRTETNPDKVNLSELYSEYNMLKIQKNEMYKSFTEIKKELKELDIIRQNVENTLSVELIEKSEISKHQNDMQEKKNENIER